MIDSCSGLRPSTKLMLLTIFIREVREHVCRGVSESELKSANSIESQVSMWTFGFVLMIRQQMLRCKLEDHSVFRDTRHSSGLQGKAKKAHRRMHKVTDIDLAGHLACEFPQAQQVEASLQSHHQLAFLVAQAWMYTCEQQCTHVAFIFTAL